MLLTVENIPDAPVSHRNKIRSHNTFHDATSDTLDSVIRTLDNVAFIDEEIPYHARVDSRPFTYGSVVENTGKLIKFGLFLLLILIFLILVDNHNS